MIFTDGIIIAHHAVSFKGNPRVSSAGWQKNSSLTGLYIDVRNDYSPGSSFFGLINAVRIYDRAKIGASSDGTDRFFEGSIDNVRVYERALSGIEISDMSKGIHVVAYEGSSRLEHGKAAEN